MTHLSETLAPQQLTIRLKLPFCEKNLVFPIVGITGALTVYNLHLAHFVLTTALLTLVADLCVVLRLHSQVYHLVPALVHAVTLYGLHRGCSADHRRK